MMIVRSKSLSWKPRRVGDIYCAPACGYHCKYKDYLKTKKDAAALNKRLGYGFKPVVWENGGWNYRVQKGPVTVYFYQEEPERYTASITGGVFFHAKSPERALALLLKHQERYLQEQIEKLDQIRSCLK